MGSRFHGWIDYNNGVALVFLEWDRTFSGLEFYFIKFYLCVNSFHDDLVKKLYKVDAVGSRIINNIFPKATKMRSSGRYPAKINLSTPPREGGNPTILESVQH